MKEINKFTEKELKAYLDKYRAIQRDATRRSRSRGETDVKGAIREAKDAASMITNINYKLNHDTWLYNCLLYTSPSPRDRQKSRMPSSA